MLRGFVRRRRVRENKHSVKRELSRRGFQRPQVPIVNRIKGSSEKAEFQQGRYGLRFRMSLSSARASVSSFLPVYLARNFSSSSAARVSSFSAR